MSGMEKVKFLHHASGLLNASQQQQLAQQLFSAEEQTQLDTRLSGLGAQDELTLLLLFLKCCREIVPLEQGPTVAIGESIPSDFLCNFPKGIGPAFIEAKSTSDDSVKVSKSDRDKRRKFAETFRLPLYYAVRIRGMWGLYSDSEVEKVDGQIKIENFATSKFNEVTGHYYLLFTPGLTIEKEYEVGPAVDQQGPRHSDYGSLVRFKIAQGEAKLEISDVQNDNRQLMITILGPLSLWDGLKRKVQRLDRRTVVIEKLNTPLIVPLHQFLLGPLYRIKTNEGEHYDPVRYLKDLQDGKSQLISLDLVESVLNEVRSAGIGFFKLG